MAWCCVNGAVTGLLISLLGAFYSSPNFVPALAIINSTQELGIPFNTLKAKMFGNMASVLIIAIFSVCVMTAVSLGGGIGLAYTGIFFLGYVCLTLIFFVSGGICSNVRQISSVVDLMNLKYDQQEEEDDYENDEEETALMERQSAKQTDRRIGPLPDHMEAGTRQASYISRNVSNFASAYMGLFLMGFYCMEKEGNIIDI